MITDHTVRKKSNISDAFSSHAHEYDLWAQVQQQANEDFIIWASEFLWPLTSPALEWGCGTGDFSERLLKKNTGLSLHVTDISSGMVAKAKEKLKNYPSVTTSVLDAIKISDWATYRTIASTLALQWLSDPFDMLRVMHKNRRPGDQILLSWFTEDSFPEWKKVCEETGLPFTGRSLPSPDFFHALVLEDSNVSFDFRHNHIQYPVKYHSARLFFKSLKAIGAGVGNGRKLTLREFHDLEKALDKNSECTITWSVAFGLIQYK